MTPPVAASLLMRRWWSCRSVRSRSPGCFRTRATHSSYATTTPDRLLRARPSACWSTSRPRRRRAVVGSGWCRRAPARCAGVDGGWSGRFRDGGPRHRRDRRLSAVRAAPAALAGGLEHRRCGAVPAPRPCRSGQLHRTGHCPRRVRQCGAQRGTGSSSSSTSESSCGRSHRCPVSGSRCLPQQESCVQDRRRHARGHRARRHAAGVDVRCGLDVHRTGRPASWLPTGFAASCCSATAGRGGSCGHFRTHRRSSRTRSAAVRSATSGSGGAWVRDGGAERAVNPVPATGGREAEPLDRTTMRAGGELRRAARTVTVSDAEDLARVPHREPASSAHMRASPCTRTSPASTSLLRSR